MLPWVGLQGSCSSRRPLSLLPPPPQPSMKLASELLPKHSALWLLLFLLSLLKGKTVQLAHLSRNSSRNRNGLLGGLFPLRPFFLQRRKLETQNRSHLRTVQLFPPTWESPITCPGFLNMPSCSNLCSDPPPIQLTWHLSE